MSADPYVAPGEDAMARDYVLQGGDGVISVTANVAPATVAKVMAAAAAKDATAAYVVISVR